MVQMDLISYIRELLLKHDCVIIPEFGGFIGNYKPAQIDRESHGFFPPQKMISFNRNLSQNDGLLIGKISERESISYDEAKNIVEDFVKTLKDRLANGETVVFEQIGSFSNNREGNVLFEPDRNVNYNLDAYGLSSFKYEPLHDYGVEHSIKSEPSYSKKISRKKIWWSAAVIIPAAALIAALSFNTDIFKKDVEFSSLNPLATTELESNETAINEESTVEIVEVKVPEVKEEEVNIAEPVVAPIVNKETFSVVTGSFKVKGNAESQVSALSKAGYAAEITETSNGFYRVSVGQYGSMAEATSQQEILISKDFPGCWIKKN